MEIMRGWRIMETQTTVQTKTSSDEFTNNNNKILSSIIIDPKEGTSKQFNDSVNQSIYVSFAFFSTKIGATFIVIIVSLV